MPFDATPVTSPSIECLRLARAKIEAGWCRRAAFRQTRSGPKYCAIGAIGNPGSNAQHLAQWFLCRALPRGRSSVVHYNDTHTQADVLALYDRAIDLAIADELARHNGAP